MNKRCGIHYSQLVWLYDVPIHVAVRLLCCKEYVGVFGWVLYVHTTPILIYSQQRIKTKIETLKRWVVFGDITKFQELTKSIMGAHCPPEPDSLKIDFLYGKKEHLKNGAKIKFFECIRVWRITFHINAAYQCTCQWFQSKKNEILKELWKYQSFS